MAARSTRVILENRTNTDFALVKADDHLDHGIWSARPPDFVGQRAEWRSESEGLGTGTEGWVIYEAKRQDLSRIISLRLSWDNPFLGGNSYSASVEPQGSADGSGFSVGYFGGVGDDAQVTFILLSGDCTVDRNSGEVICTESTPLVDLTKGIIYAINANNDLLWYRHDGRADGSFKWLDNNARKVGVGWDVKHIFSGGDGIIYAINADNDLLWYRHDGRADGSFKWLDNNARKVGVGWDVKHIFSGG
jgi:hypothetical protein